MKKNAQIDVTLVDIYDQLSKGDKKLADLILELKGDFQGYSATEIARFAGVSKATATRFFRKLGYANFEEARHEARLAANWGSPLKNYEMHGGDTEMPCPVDQIGIEHTNISRTYERISAEQLVECMDILQNARTIWVAGFRSSYGVAHYCSFLLKMIVNDVRILPQVGQSFAEELSSMTNEDCLIAIGFRKRPTNLRLLMEKTRSIGLKNIYITDTSAAGTARLAHTVFRCHTRGPYLFDSQATGFSLINFLVTSFALRLGSSAITRLAEIDRLHDEIDSFSHK